ncbi:MAG: cysteine hydrolase family protein [Syntrophothermus sp.]
MKTALLIIDIQNDYFPGGKMELEGAEQAGMNAQRLLSLFRNNSLPLFHIQHFSTKPSATFFIPGTPGVEINECVRPAENELIIKKNFPNSFRDTDLLGELKAAGISDLIITGMMTHMCIDATTRAAFDFRFNCTVVNDACATRALTLGGSAVTADNVHKAFLAALGSVYAKILTTEEVTKAY